MNLIKIQTNKKNPYCSYKFEDTFAACTLTNSEQFLQSRTKSDFSQNPP